MMKNKLLKFVVLTLLFCGVDSVFSQEWEVVEHFAYLEDESFLRYKDAMELSNGNVLATGYTYFRNNIGQTRFSHHPSLVLISPEGEEICRNLYFRKNMCIIAEPYLFEKDGERYMLAAYNPDHDRNSDNHFNNNNNPPTESIIGLYSLDEDLEVKEAYEHIFPIDTFEYVEYPDWEENPDVYSGHIHIYSAFEDEGNITGSYIKTAGIADAQNDSVFFFKMDFEGNMLLNKGHRKVVNESRLNCHRQLMVKTDNGYNVYYDGGSQTTHSRVEYYDNDLNYIDTRYVLMPEQPVHKHRSFQDHSVMRSNHNTTYVATRSRSLKIPNWDDNVRLYEFDDDLDNSEQILPVLRYIEREPPIPQKDCTPQGEALGMTSEGDIYFAYTLNFGDMNGTADSWVMIERLDSSFDTISTLFYEEGVGINIYVHAIQTTEDDGLLLITRSKKLDNLNEQWTKVVRIPASVFGIDNIEEAHAHGLKAAIAYPNPGGEVMNVRTSLRDCSLSVYDMQGRIIYQQEITDNITSVDASSWPQGTYVWKLTSNNEQKTVEEGKWVK